MRASVRAFRGLRFVPSRVELGAVVGSSVSAPVDPRHVRTLLDDTLKPDDGVGAATRRAKLRLAEWQRAGLLKRDDQPAVYAVRRRDEDGTEAMGLFCAVGVDAAASSAGSGAASGASGVPSSGGAAEAAREARFELGVAVEPVVARFDEARVKRTVENAVDREADASWRVGKTQFELWCLDEESTTARIATLLSQAAIELEHNADSLAAQASWWKRVAGAVDDDRPRAGAFALAFLHSSEDAWPEVPVGAALAPLTGALE